MKDSQTVAALPSRGLRIRNLRRTVAHRWPALLGAAVVTAAMPLTVALAETQSFTRSSFFADTGPAVQVTTNTGTALEAQTHNGPAIDAESNSVAIVARICCATGPSVAVDADSFGADTGVKAGASLVGVDAFGGTTGVKASSNNGVGVDATSGTGTAVQAHGKTGGVDASSSDEVAIRALGKTGGVIATANGDNSSGVSAFGFGANSPGLFAEGTIGAELNGSSAPLRLDPATTTGAPKATSGAHKRGEFYVDVNGVLFYCTADGTPGTWKQLS